PQRNSRKYTTTSRPPWQKGYLFFSSSCSLRFLVSSIPPLGLTHDFGVFKSDFPSSDGRGRVSRDLFARIRLKPFQWFDLLTMFPNPFQSFKTFNRRALFNSLSD